MKKQYLTGLLGFVVIFAPLANSLINTNSNLCNSINNQTQEESIISEENSQVIVKDLDYDGKTSQGDQIDEIDFSVNYNVFHSLYENESKTILSNEYRLNIYTENSTNTIKSFYSVSYNKINSLNQNQNVGFLDFNFNSTDNSNWKIWNTKLPENNQKFIITAKAEKDNYKKQPSEIKIGEIKILSKKQEKLWGPIINYPTAVKIDKRHNILEVQGKIKLRDSSVNDVYLTKYKTSIQSETIRFEQIGDEIIYDIWTPDYIENDKAGVSSYQVNADYNLGGEQLTVDYSLSGVFFSHRTTDENLKYLISSNTFPTLWVIIGIITLSIFGFIFWHSHLRKNKIKEMKNLNQNDNQNQNNEENNFGNDSKDDYN